MFLFGSVMSGSGFKRSVSGNVIDLETGQEVLILQDTDTGLKKRRGKSKKYLESEGED